MYGSSGFSETARLRIDDDIRRAEAYRLSRQTRHSSTKASRGRMRSVGRSVLAVVLSPIKH